MSEMRNRAKEHFPMVLLTLLSIVQALALELLWSYVRDNASLLVPSWPALLEWIQIVATFLGLVLIWIVYASAAMRFRWVPVTSDSVYPFLIGVIEFMLIEALGPDTIGQWLLLIALVYAVMVRVSHTVMRRARQDADNDVFFRNFAPATLRDFSREIAVVCVLAAAGIYLLTSGDSGIFALIAVLGAAGILAWQFHLSAGFWRSTVIEADSDEER